MAENDTADTVLVRLRLFVNGDRAGAQEDLAAFRALLDAEIPEAYELQVIDVSVDPGAALAEKIRATPFLIRELPEPVRRALGGLRSRKILAAIGIESEEQER